MAVLAKISPLDQPVGAASERTLANAVQLSQSSNVALNLPPEAIAGYTREGGDLLVQMQNGEVLRIGNFYLPNELPSQLFLVDEEQLIAVDLTEAASDGILAASYGAENGLAGFTSLTTAGATSAGALGMGTAALIGGAAIAGGALLADGIGGGGSNSSSGGNDDGGGSAPVVPPTASDLQVSPDGRQLTGRADPGTGVRVDVNGDGIPDYSAVVGDDGQFVLPLEPPLSNGEIIDVVIVDPAGNPGPITSVTAPDTTAPAQPTQLLVSAQGDLLTGLAEAGSRVEIDTNGDGIADAFVLAGADGRFSFVLSPALVGGEAIGVWAIDAAGNRGQTAAVNAPDVQAPDMPRVNPSNGTELTGTAPPGSTIEMTGADGTLIGRTTADANGNWAFAPATPWLDGTVVDVSAINTQGVRTPIVRIVIDRVAPDAPTVEPSNGVLLTGTAEANSSITLTIGNNPAVTILTNANGVWQYSPNPALADGTQVSVVATDRAGNSSQASTLIIDALPPPVPQINISNGVLFGGTAEAGSTVLLSTATGGTFGSARADANGNWSFVANPPIAHGTQVNVVARDAVGNTSSAATTIIDAVPPAAPSILPSDGQLLSGMAEPGSTVIISDANGRVIGRVTADDNGNWSLTPVRPLEDGTRVSAIAQDAAGNRSEVASTVIDTGALPRPLPDPSNGITLSGSSEAHATITLTGPGGVFIGETVADENGQWSFTPAAALLDGTVISVVASDSLGNTSAAATITVDAVAPLQPTINPSNGSGQLQGTAEANSTLLLSIGDDEPVRITVGANGNWSHPLTSPLDHQVSVSAVAVDAAGNASPPTSIRVDRLAPDAPQIEIGTSTLLSGTAEAGSKISILSVINGQPTLITRVTADAQGNWSYVPVPALADGVRIEVTATDAAGNVSPPSASVTIDSTAPAEPSITPSNGLLISGTAEAGATVILTTTGGVSLGEVRADEQGRWSFEPVNQLLDGTVVVAVARDAAGNLSNPVNVTVDTIAPVEPSILPSSGRDALSGKAEAGSLISLSINGEEPVTVRADNQGNWRHPLPEALPHGTVIVLSSSDAAGNVSPSITFEVDTQAPPPPQLQPSNGTELSGTAEIGSTVTITFPAGSGRAPISVTADANGYWAITLDPALDNGVRISATATDAAGNRSGEVEQIINTTLPPHPTIEPSDGSELSGTALANITVLIRLPDGSTEEVRADAEGVWSFTPDVPLEHDAVVSVVARDANGNLSASVSTIIDSIAPELPTIEPSNGLLLSGTAEAGSTVIVTGAGGRAIGQTIADAAGKWTLLPEMTLAHGLPITAVARDAAGNISAPARTTIDNIAPTAPSVSPSNGTQISGRAEAGATLLVTDASGRIIGRTTVETDGSWSITPSPTLAHGAQIAVVARDAAGNQSPPVSISIDAVPPGKPVIEVSSGSLLSGSAEAGSTLIISANGAPIAEVGVDAQGNWSFTPGSPLPHGTLISLVARDAAGNESPATNVAIDTQAPAAPSIDASNGLVLSGSAEAGSTVILQGSGGLSIGQAIADADGRWTFTPTPALPNGLVVSAVARDTAGNLSTAVSTTIDALAPAAPIVDPSNGVQLSGLGEIGSTVVVTNSSGQVIGEALVGAGGRWTIIPSPALPHDAVLSVVARDAVGNSSAAVQLVIDRVAPVTPTLSPSNGSELSGTAEAGSTVIISGPDGTIGEAVASAAGSWSFRPENALSDGTPVSVVSRDAAGNISLPATGTIDAATPDLPTIDPSNGKHLAGTAEANSRVIVSGPDGATLGEVTADADGKWALPLTPELPDGTRVTVISRDELGNQSPPASILIDAIAPATPLINPSNAVSISGTAEAGSLIEVRVDNDLIGVTRADADGNWRLELEPDDALAHATPISVTASDAAGNTSAAAIAQIDAQAPGQPNILPSNGIILTGSAEAGSTLLITGTPGGILGQVRVGADGNWTFTPPRALAHDTQISIVARDAAGNDSPEASISIDNMPPAPPTVAPSNGVSLSGTGEIGSTVILTAPGGVSIGEALVDSDGKWSFLPEVRLLDGTLVSVKARDAAGNTSQAVQVSVDALAPLQPTIEPSQGLTFTGTAEADSTVTLRDTNGNPLAPPVVAIDGTWSITLGAELPHGTQVSVVASDAVGNVSPPASITVDSIAPGVPTVAASNGLILNGTAEAGSTVIVSVDGTPIGQAIADVDGVWSFTPPTALPNDLEVSVSAVDAAGNRSDSVEIRVDNSLPDLPTIAPSNGSQLSGTAEAGSTVTITVGGQPLGVTTADPITGAWSLNPLQPLTHASVVSVTATDAAGNVSAPAVAIIDAQPPAAPIVQPSNGKLLSGTAEIGSTVILSDANGQVIGQTTANASGVWSFAPLNALPNQAQVTAVARDAAGNTSEAATVTVDAMAPATPILQPSNGSLLTGTAEGGATIIVTGPGGARIGTTVAAADGTWSLIPSPALAHGVAISVVARDAAGNTSAAAGITIDAIAPNTPTINPSAGLIFSGSAEANSKVILSVAGLKVGEATADANGAWTTTLASPVAHGLTVRAVAQDGAGNISGPATTIVDSVPPAKPSVLQGLGGLLSGAAEAGSSVEISVNGTPIGTTTAGANGSWSFTPSTTLPHGATVSVIARDAAGNPSEPGTTSIDTLAPAAPSNLLVSVNGTLLTGTAEAGSQVRIIVNGNTANPILVTAGAGNTFAAALIPALLAGQAIVVTATDAAGNVSAPGSIFAPNNSAPTISVPEAADSYINAAEALDGIQVRVGLASGVRLGDTVTVDYSGTSGYRLSQSYVVTNADLAAGHTVVSVMPPAGGFPQGAASVSAHINSGSSSQAVNFTVDTIPPQAPVLSLLGSLLTISSEPHSELTVRVNIAGIEATATVTANNAGIASLNLLTGLNINLDLTQLLNAQISVTARDVAGNQSAIARLGLGIGLQQEPVTLGDLAVEASLNPLDPKLGISGKTVAGAALAVELISPLLNVSLAPLAADADGHFSINVLSPNVLSQLGLNLSGLLNLGQNLELRITATADGGTSGTHVLDLHPLGLLGLQIGAVRVEDTTDDSVLSAASLIGVPGLADDDLALEVGSDERVEVTTADDTLHITAGAGFETLLFDGGISLNYDAANTGTLHNIERIDLGSGDTGSTLTLSAAAVDAMTDARNTLQITGESNDVLNVVGASKGGVQQIGNITYDVYSHGATTLLVEENTVQVVVA